MRKYWFFPGHPGYTGSAQLPPVLLTDTPYDKDDRWDWYADWPGSLFSAANETEKDEPALCPRCGAYWDCGCPRTPDIADVTRGLYEALARIDKALEARIDVSGFRTAAQMMAEWETLERRYEAFLRQVRADIVGSAQPGQPIGIPEIRM